jgi:hypothetical protein
MIESVRIEFSPEFLSILISTNRAAYDGGQDIRFIHFKFETHEN